MNKIKLGVLREGKTPPDKRVPLTPPQCVEVMRKFTNVEVIVQPSPIRSIPDAEYLSQGIKMQEDLSDCDILIGVKEVKIADLIPNKKYLFFSHTYKKQPYNRSLLQAILDKKIQLIDYEILKNAKGNRIIGFGRYAGIVGCYNGFLAFGKKHNLYDLKPANQCADRVELEQELKKIKLPKHTKIVATGFGRVGNGAREIFSTIGLKEVEPEDFLNKSFDEPVYSQLEVCDYFAREDGAAFSRKEFFKSGAGHISIFNKYLAVADMYVACHYWHSSSPFIITREDLKSPDVRVSVISDISCDIDGPVASTLRPSTIADPLYGYDPQSEKEVDFMAPQAIGVQAVDNLPCELPMDASDDFGSELIKEVFPALFGSDPDNIIKRASETDLNGALMPNYSYLEEYLQEKN
ncbi:NAD(P)-dependent oxidoreductase [Crocinitomix catalasitica]|uniref:NAD(P)-dependent oxidoreductase n=1 Tax=Crocinitomix catalasitica TaxID=184607 RepID=UPI000B28B421|nr:NAD(P)-dependent oxidoreductase [Crocinitomix catalasitica]